ncbi:MULTISPECIES: hypothetical protein [unclassified Methylobacterium]|uniref:hypothetical protein n=1 Tax=unclassified Methylobacterium TaxID=2615210 RepID=UPI003701185C
MSGLGVGRPFDAATPDPPGQTIDTQITPNCNARTEATFDINDSTWVTFYFQNTVPLWRALLSIAGERVTLMDSIQACGIVLSEGLTLTLNPMGGVYTVLLDGVIVDAGTTYKCIGLLLGSFSRTAEMKDAVKSIRMGVREIENLSNL